MRRVAAVALCVLALACAADVTVGVGWYCRGDSTPATADTNLIRCATLDSLARRDTTRRP